MRYCTRCLYPENHPLTITFNEDGVCSGCLTHEEKDDLIDWPAKETEFKKLIEPYKNQPGSFYDCIIPVTGTGDDFYVVDLMKNKMGMNPLLVTYNSQFNTKVGIRNLCRLITELDCDHILSTVGPETVKKVTKATLQHLGTMYWHVQAGNLTFPVQVGTKLRIPLIIWGVHGWSDQVGMFSHLNMVEMTKKVRKEHSLKMFEAEELLKLDIGLIEQDLIPWTYPSDDQLEQHRVRGLYISNFFRWDSQKQTEDMIDKYGFEATTQNRTFNNYETIHCHNNAETHDYFKYIKYGYGKATDHACRDIRLKRLTREQGIELALKYDSIKPSNLDSFAKWLGVSEAQILEWLEKFRSQDIWEKDESGQWVLRHSILDDHKNNIDQIENSRLKDITPRPYRTSELLEPEDNEYILIGRNYMDENNFKAYEG